MDKRQALHYMTPRGWPLVHIIHTPYDYNDVVSKTEGLGSLGAVDTRDNAGKVR